MPCANENCRKNVDWDDISWHRCDGNCITREAKTGLWVATLWDDQQKIVCSKHSDGSYWFFFCDVCKRSALPKEILRGSRIVQRSDGICDYTTDSSNVTDWTSESSNPTDTHEDNAWKFEDTDFDVHGVPGSASDHHRA